MKFLGRRQATTSELDKRSPERQKAPRKHEFPGAFSSRADWRLLQPNDRSATLFDRAIALSWEFTPEDFAAVDDQ